MTKITIGIAHETDGAKPLSRGHLRITDAQRRVDGGLLLLPQSFTVKLDGEEMPTITLDEGTIKVVEEFIPGSDSAASRAFTVPAPVVEGETETPVMYSALTFVDPESLEPVENAPVTVQQQLNALDAGKANKDELGTAAAEDATAFATAEQGAKADTAVQPGALGTAATQDVTAFATRGRFPVFQIALDGGTDPVDTENYLPGTYTITDTDGGVIHSGAINLRGRGNSTWSLAKKPWRVNFAVKTQPLDMTANQKNWALLANHYDRAKVNNDFYFDLGHEADGLAWTPEHRTVELVLNGTFRGLYSLTDLVRLESGRVPGDEASGDGSEGVWLLEITNKESPANIGEDAEPGFYSSVYNQWFIYDTPETPDGTQETYIQTLIGDFEDAIRDGRWEDWAQYADATSIADWWLVNEWTRNQDSGFWSSCKVTVTDGIIALGPLWDGDLSLGIKADGSLNEATGWHTRAAAWLYRLWNDAAFRSLMQERWALIRDAINTDLYMDSTIDGQQRALDDDNRKWSQTTYVAFEADRRKRFLTDRRTWLDEQITPDPSPVTATVAATV